MSLEPNYLPNLPHDIMRSRAVGLALTGKTITGATWTKYLEGSYSWHGETIAGLEDTVGGKIMFADASFILTDNGKLIFYAIPGGDVRYYRKGDSVILPKTKKAVSHAYHMVLSLDDGCHFGLNLYGWGTTFKVHDVDLQQIDTQQQRPTLRYPFLPRAPIDVPDPDDFTLEKLQDWLADKPGMNVIEACATCKGAFGITNPVMNYILLLSKVHPRTKVRALCASDIQAIYENTKILIGEYQSGVRVCNHTDLFGRQVAAQNDVLWMTGSTLGSPCPLCGTVINATPAAGTKMYFCPSCQVVKK